MRHLSILILLLVVSGCGKDNGKSGVDGGNPDGGPGGEGWTKLDTSTASSIGVLSGQDVVALGNRILVSTERGVVISDDDGETWKPANSGFDADTGVGDMIVVGNDILASNDNGLYVSSNRAGMWTPVAASGLPTTVGIYTSMVLGSEVLVGMNAGSLDPGISGGLFRTADLGATFSPSSTGLPQNEAVTSFATDGTTTYCAVIESVGRSADGHGWQTSALPVSDNVLTVATLHGKIFAGTASKGVYVSTDAVTWQGSSSGLPASTPIEVLFVDGGKLYASMTDNHGVYVSSDDGASWTAFNEGFGIAPPYVVAFLVHDGFMFGPTELDGVWRRKL